VACVTTNRVAKLAGAFLLGAVLAATAAEGWLTSFEEAKTLAAEKKLPILMDFSGSDWCMWCQRLSAEVFTQQAFKDYAKDNLVLLLVDSPMRAKQAPELTAQNRKLQSAYRAFAFPAVVLTDAAGEEIARTGYRKGGAEAYVEHLKGLLAGKRADADPAGH
jgi:thioredoxin-related protein